MDEANNPKLIIAIICGRVKKESDGHWKSVGYDDFGGSSSSPGSRARVEAGALLYRANPHAVVATFGGGGSFIKGDEGALSLASVSKGELVALGVPNEAVIAEHLSCNTYQQLCALSELARRYSQAKIIAISNRYHLERIRAMIMYAPKVKGVLSIREVELVAAEDILIKHDRARWEGEILSAYVRPEMQKLVESEKRGVAQIISGSYKYNSSSLGSAEKFYDTGKTSTDVEPKGNNGSC